MTDRPNPISTPLRGTDLLTITMFGERDEVGDALSQELGRRGCRTHAVSVETGWLASASNAICRIDTVVGQRAMEALAGRERPRATVIAVCEKPRDEYASKRLHDLCQECGRHHDVTLIWHSPVAEAPATDHPPLEPLAVAVADQASAQVNVAGGSSFTTRYVDLASGS